MNKTFTTNSLMQMLCDEPDSFMKLRFTDDTTLCAYLAGAMAGAGLTAQELIIRTQLSKSYVYQVLDGTRIPSRNAVLRFALVLRLELPEVQRLLARAGKSSLYPKVRRDAALIACIVKRLTLEGTDEFLESIGEQTSVMTNDELNECMSSLYEPAALPERFSRYTLRSCLKRDDNGAVYLLDKEDKKFILKRVYPVVIGGLLIVCAATSICLHIKELRASLTVRSNT